VELSGSQIVIEELKANGVEIAFGIPGGAIMPFYDELQRSKFPHILTRHEQGATHMADGYARVSGKVAAVVTTSGPGATNTITGLCNALMDSVPMIVITGQVATPAIGTDAFQEADIFSITMPVVKHNFLVKNTNDLPRIAKEAYYIATTGRPGPVLVDVPKNVSQDPFDGDLDPDISLPGYHPERAFEIEEDAIDKVAELAAEINYSVENIGARRLHTVLERLLEEISFTATDRGGETVHITAQDVRDRVADLAKDADLSKFIL